MPVTRRGLRLVTAAIVGPILVVLAVVNWSRLQATVNTATSGGDTTIEVPTNAMSPTIQKGDSLAVSTEEPFQLQVGDVVTTPLPGEAASGGTTLKRIIAIGPADVTIADGRVLVDGKAIDEPYLEPGTMTEAPSRAILACEPALPCHVPEGSFWGMGDNRRESADSRIFGPLPLDQVDGVVLAIVAPSNRTGEIAGSPE